MISKDLIKIIHTLQKINNLPKIGFINECKIKTEIENIPDCTTREFAYEKIISELLELTTQDLERTVIVNGEKINKVTKLLIDLHLCLSDFIWHLEQVNELTVEMIKQSK